MKNYMKYICLFLMMLGISTHAWGAESSVATFVSYPWSEIGSSYTDDCEDDDWYLSIGGGNDRAGFNKNAHRTIGNNFGTGANASHAGWYMRSKKALANVCKVTFTYTQCSSASECDNARMYLAYSTNGSTWSAVTLTSGTQGMNVGPNDDPSDGLNTAVYTFEFNKIASAYYAVIISRNGSVSSGQGFAFSHTTIDFIGGCCDYIVTPAKGTMTNCDITFDPSEVATCSSTASERQLTITVTPASCYAAPTADAVARASGITCTKVSGPTAIGGGKYNYVFQFAQNQSGTTTFNASITSKTTYTVSYNGGSTTPTGGNSISGSHANDTKTCGEPLTLPGATFSATGYTQTGWSTTNGGSQTHSLSGSYTTNAAQTFYPVWTANTISLTLNKNNSDASGSANGSGTVKYNGTTATISTAATRSGYLVEGYYAEPECTNKVMTASGGLVNYTGYVVGGKWKRTTATTLYAKWTEQRTLAVANVNYVTISATSPSVAENASALVTPGTSVTLTHNTPTSPYTWCGWNVYKTEDPSTKVTVTSNSFTMPDYDVTVSAFLFGDLRAFCEPPIEITVDGSVWLTSYASVPVYTTNNPNNLITVTCSNFGSANKLGVTYLQNGDPVAKGSSLFRLCYYGLAGQSDYSVVDGTNDYISLSAAVKTAIASGQTFAIRYTPEAGVYNREDTYTLRLTALNGSEDLGHVDVTLHGRALPQKFVVAANIGGQWRALPADLATSAGTTIQDAYPIQVDNIAAPTSAIAPKTAIYSAAARNEATKHRGGVRLHTETGTNDGYLEAPRSNDLTYLWRTTSSCSTGMQEWYLKSSDFTTYNISVDPNCTLSDGSTPITRYLCVYSNQIMWTSSATASHREFRILPVTEYTPIDLQVVEWQSDKIRFMYLGNPDYEVEVKIDNVTKASTAELSTLKIDHGVYEIAVSDLMSSAYKQMHLIFKNSGTEVGRKDVNVPLLVNSVTTVASAASGFTKGTQCPEMDLVVLSGGLLTADDETAYQFKTISVYGGGKLVVAASKGLTAKTGMYLRAGSISVASKGATPSTSYIYTYPQVYIGSSATLTVPDNIINFDYLTNYDQYFGLALPYPVTINATTGIFYPDDIYGAAAKRGSFLLRAFDSKIRAEQGAVKAVWVDVETGSSSSGGSIAAQSNTARGLGYTMLGVPLKVSVNGGTATRQTYGIHRMKMNVTSAASLTTSETSNASISVTAYGADQIYNTGWTLLGNPYMTNLNGAGVGGTGITYGSIGTNAQGQPEMQNTTFRYVTVPDDTGGDTYDQRKVSDYTFPAFKPFYVQIGTSGTVTFAQENRKADAPRRFREEEMPEEIETSIALNATESGDTTHILIGEAFSDAYEFGDDMVKMPHSNVALFTISGTNELFANALNAQSASAGIPVGYTAPSAGTYVFSWNDKVNSTWIQHLWLTDLDLSTQTDLLVDSYEFETEAGTNKTRFVLVVELKKKTDVTTDIDDVRGESDKPLKFIYHNKMYILRNGVIYDATGKRVQTINK